MAYTCVRVIFEIGHIATIRNEPTREGFTHDWELFLRGADNTEIHHFVEKVIFHLHESFPNHRRVVKEPPYMVCETGYAGFPLQIDIYLKNKHEPSRIRFHYHLTLQDKGPPYSNVKREKYVFKNPSEDFRRKLIKGGGVGVGADSASSSHTNHMAALNSDHSTNEHKSVNNKNKASPPDVSVSSKKSKKENTPKNEEQLSANDPFSIFGQPIKTSKIPLVSKSSSKNQISDKQPLPQDKQSHSSKSSKHSTSSHKDKEKDKERGGGGGSVEKEKTKDKDKNSNSMKRSKESVGSEISSSSSKKDKFKDDKVRILKVSSKDDSKKNSYHEEKPAKEKSSSSEKSSSTVVIERTSSSGRGSADKELLKFEKKDKDKKHKDEKKSKSKDKYKQNEKKENIDVVMKESYVNERSEKLFSNKDDYKEEKKFHRIANDDKDNKADKISSKDKGGGAIAETKNLFNNVNNNNNNSSTNNNNSSSNSNNNNNSADSQIINNGDNTQRSKEPVEGKHKHHKHKKDKSKKDSKRDKEERKEKKESKENKEKFSMEQQQQHQQQQQQQQPQSQSVPAAPSAQLQPPAATATPQSRSTPKSATTDSPRRLKKPVKALFEPDNSDSEFSSMDDDLPPPSLPPAHHRLMPPKEILSSPSPEMNLIKDEPVSGYNKHEDQTKEEKYETTSSKKKKKNSEERENKKRKRKSKDKEENTSSKMIKYENNCSQGADLASKPADLTGSDRRPPKSVSPSETKFTDEYITKLKELQRKIMTLEDNSGLQRIVQVVAETGQYEITTKTFDFDLCTLDESIVQRLLDFFVP